MSILSSFVAVNPIITQDPYPVTFGGIVKVICNATEHAKLQWKASDETVLEPDGPGVKGISFEGLVSTLKVDVSSFHGRMVSCGVENENATWKSYNICGEGCMYMPILTQSIQFMSFWPCSAICCHAVRKC